jgi:hypothetical protein
LGAITALTRWERVLVGCALAAALLAAASAQVLSGPRESAVKAAFLIKFASFVEWPRGPVATPQAPLVIGVLGDDSLFADLEQLAQGQSVNGRPVVARRLRELPGERDPVHILFLAASSEGRLEDLVSRVTGPVLIVTQSGNALSFGAALNFVVERGRVRFEASPRAPEAHGLKLSSRLLAVARSVEERSP